MRQLKEFRQEQIDNYMKNLKELRGIHCPHCESPACFIAAKYFRQSDFKCHECGNAWTEIYEVKTIVPL